MIFSHFARIIAIAAFVVGLYGVLIGAAAAMGFLDEAAKAGLLGPLGQAIDLGIWIFTVLFAVLLGTLAEISFSMRKSNQGRSNEYTP